MNTHVHTIPKQVATYHGLNWLAFNILTSIALYTCATLFHELMQEPAVLNSPLPGNIGELKIWHLNAK